MAAAEHTAWAIDIGNNSLKALRLQVAGEGVEVLSLDYIEHGKILSDPDITDERRSDIIAQTLQTFIQRNNIDRNEKVAVSIPGQNSFARFVKLPPVEPKRIPEIVKFEAVQQIPFDINEVEWDWQIMEKPDSPDVEVGIFAIKNELISDHLENFSNGHIRISVVQMAPIALYNYIHHDRDDLDADDGKAIVVLDMGAENTDLIVCTKYSVWQRCIPMGGNAFTEAISEAFKLRFSKAEKLKRGAVMSKHARQIFHSMRPVFTDFAGEVQRSLGYYSSSNPGAEFSNVIVLGGGFKLRGLVKYLGQTLQLPVVRPDSFEKLSAGGDLSSAKLHENISDFGVVYGLGLQALGMAKIESNLLPGKIAQSMSWAAKSRYFTIAAGMLLVVAFMAFAKTSFDNKAYFSRDAESSRKTIKRAIEQSNSAKQKLGTENKRDSGYEKTIAKHMDNFKYRSVIPSLYETITTCLPNAENNPEQSQVYDSFEQNDIAGLFKTPRDERKQLFVTTVAIDYAESLIDARLESSRRRRRRDRGNAEMQGGGMMSGFGPGMMSGGFGPGMRGSGMRGPGGYSSKKKFGKSKKSGKNNGESSDLKDGAGFVILIEGYSPYGKIDELLDPANVAKEPSRWGYITRLMNLDMMAADGNSPFKLFAKEEFEHFRLETGEVEIEESRQGQDMPEGIGVREEKERVSVEEEYAASSKGRDRTGRKRPKARRTKSSSDRVTSEMVLVDSMTKEEISKTFDLNEKGEKKYDEFGEPIYIVRDHWFRIRAKLLWKDAPDNKEDEKKDEKKKKRRKK